MCNIRVTHIQVCGQAARATSGVLHMCNIRVTRVQVCGQAARATRGAGAGAVGREYAERRRCHGRAQDCAKFFWCVCCSVLQCVAVCCSVLQCVAVCCGVLQCVAVCCAMYAKYAQKFGHNTQQHTCGVLRCVAEPRTCSRLCEVAVVCVLRCVVVCCGVLRCVAVCCGVLQCAGLNFLSTFCIYYIHEHAQDCARLFWCVCCGVLQCVVPKFLCMFGIDYIHRCARDCAKMIWRVYVCVYVVCTYMQGCCWRTCSHI